MKPERKQRPVLEIARPWIAPELEPALIYAIKAWSQGKASEGQQVNVFRWLMFDLCLLGHSGFHPGAPGIDGARVTDFMLGMQQVARVLASAIDAKVRAEPDPRGPPPETPSTGL